MHEQRTLPNWLHAGLKSRIPVLGIHHTPLTSYETCSVTTSQHTHIQNASSTIKCIHGIIYRNRFRNSHAHNSNNSKEARADRVWETEAGIGKMKRNHAGRLAPHTEKKNDSECPAVLSLTCLLCCVCVCVYVNDGWNGMMGKTFRALHNFPLFCSSPTLTFTDLSDEMRRAAASTTSAGRRSAKNITQKILCAQNCEYFESSFYISQRHISTSASHQFLRTFSNLFFCRNLFCSCQSDGASTHTHTYTGTVVANHSIIKLQRNMNTENVSIDLHSESVYVCVLLLLHWLSRWCIRWMNLHSYVFMRQQICTTVNQDVVVTEA